MHADVGATLCRPIVINAYAKVNLSLAVIGTEGGMHLLDTIICPIKLCDVLTVTRRTGDGAQGITLRYTDGRPHYPNDSVLRTAKLLEAQGITGLDIVVEKHIPEGAGLGGSSADAAALLRAVDRIDLARALGGDVPALCACEPVRQCGKASDLRPVAVPKLHVAIVLQDKPVSTAECFALYDQIGGEEVDIDAFIARGFTEPKNALQRSAERLCPSIATTLRKLSGNVVMTGSGSAVIAYSTHKITVPNVQNRTVITETLA